MATVSRSSDGGCRIEGAPGVRAAIRGYGERIVSYALPMALTRAAIDARNETRNAMGSIFDRPTPYTLNSLQAIPATRKNPASAVEFRLFSGKGTPAPEYLLPQVDGGPRRLKRHERALQSAGFLPNGWFAVPGEEAQLDAYGNMKRGQIVKILSHLRAFGSAGSNLNRSRTTKSRGVRRKEGYFPAKPGNREGLPPGIYQRDGADARPVLIFVARAPAYQPRFRFHAIVQATVRRRIKEHFDVALAHIARRFSAPRL